MGSLPRVNTLLTFSDSPYSSFPHCEHSSFLKEVCFPCPGNDRLPRGPEGGWVSVKCLFLWCSGCPPFTGGWHQLSRNQSAYAWLTEHCENWLPGQRCGGGGGNGPGMWMTSWLDSVSIVIRPSWASPEHLRIASELLDLILCRFIVSLDTGLSQISA